MVEKLDRGAKLQRQYYTDTSSRYNQMHAHEGFGDVFTQRFAFSVLRMIEACSVLDVGTATGRGLLELKESLPGVFVCGLEPVAALLEQAAAERRNGTLALVRGSGEALPFPDASFDVVCEFEVLHHVARPNAVVKEMLRVAKKAVLISDSNRFGQGSRAARLIKLALYKSKLWGAYNYLRTSGKGYLLTEGDGVAYSYSVFDSFGLISRWADRIILVSSSGGKSSSWLHPLLNSPGVLVCAIKEGP
jgi:ubiquinone/menaquinone biosynthesis C-methylase UbiE